MPLNLDMMSGIGINIGRLNLLFCTHLREAVIGINVRFVTMV